jgi:ribonucleoside-diphosphate reductase alpha chain
MQNTSVMDIQQSEIIDENGDKIIVEKTKAGDFVVCNLSSVVLGNIDVNSDEEVEYVVETQIRAMDNVIDLNYYSVPFAEVTNKRYRAIGLGTSGYHHMLANNRIHWTEDKHLEFADKVYEKINFYAINASVNIAKEKGSYLYFEGSDWQTGEYFELRQYKSQEWNKLREDVKQFGMRNGYLFAVAPNGSTATIAGTSEGVDPVMARFWLEEKKGSIIPKTAPNLSWENFWYYNSAYNIEQKLCIQVNGIRQRHIDQGQSFNLYITTNYTMRQIMNLYIEACKCGVKSIYYVRSKSLTVSECDSCSA